MNPFLALQGRLGNVGEDRSPAEQEWGGSVRIIIAFSAIDAILHGNLIRLSSTDLQSYKLARTDFYTYWVTGVEARVF